MGHQFIHIEVYARQGSVQTKTGKGGKKFRSAKSSAADIAKEAEREAEYCQHVQAPQPPEILHGMKPSEAVALASAWADGELDARGHKLRKDALCLLAGVVSVAEHDADLWPEQRKRTVDWLKKKYGERLLSIVEHTDEAHPHLHFYCAPKAGERFETLHDGYKAAAAIKAAGKLKGAQNTAYREAMRNLQDTFYLDVASKVGLTRIGPKVARLTRPEWKAKQNAQRVEAKARKRDKHIKERGYKDGFDKGYGEAAKSANSLGAQVGGLLDGLKGAWHAPSKKADDEKRELERKLKEQNKRAERKLIEQEALIKSQAEELQRYKQRELEERQEEERKRRIEQSLAQKKTPADLTGSKPGSKI